MLFIIFKVNGLNADPQKHDQNYLSRVKNRFSRLRHFPEPNIPKYYFSTKPLYFLQTNFLICRVSWRTTSCLSNLILRKEKLQQKFKGDRMALNCSTGLKNAPAPETQARARGQNSNVTFPTEKGTSAW